MLFETAQYGLTLDGIPLIKYYASIIFGLANVALHLLIFHFCHFHISQKQM